MTTDTDTLEAQIRCLENENRALKMMLRDEFAMAALTGIFAADKKMQLSLEESAYIAYESADKMVEARK